MSVDLVFAFIMGCLFWGAVLFFAYTVGYDYSEDGTYIDWR